MPLWWHKNNPSPSLPMALMSCYLSRAKLMPSALLTPLSIAGLVSCWQALKGHKLNGSNEISHVALRVTSEVPGRCGDRSHIVKRPCSVTFLAVRGTRALMFHNWCSRAESKATRYQWNTMCFWEIGWEHKTQNHHSLDSALHAEAIVGSVLCCGKDVAIC